MEFRAVLGSKGGRTGILYTIYFIFLIAISLSLIEYNSNLKGLYILIGAGSLIYIRYMYYLLWKKPILFVEDNHLSYKHPLWFKRKFDLHNVLYVKLELVDFLRGVYRGIIVLYVLNENVVSRIILGGNVYDMGLDVISEKITKKAKKYNQKTISTYNELEDKSSFFSLFNMSPVRYSIFVSIVLAVAAIESYLIYKNRFEGDNIVVALIYYVGLLVITVMAKKKIIKYSWFYAITTFILITTILSSILQLFIYFVFK